MTDHLEHLRLDLDAMLDAALDGQDYAVAAECLLCHPNSRGLPEFAVRPLFAIAHGMETDVDVRKHVLGADHVIRHMRRAPA